MPLILKLNGKTNIPEDDEAVSPLNASVEDAVRLGADAIGYTLYIGTPRQDFEFLQFQKVRQDAERFGMPMVVWAYPRGRAIEARGGKGTLYAIDYAARVAEEMGADIVKLHEPNDETAGARSRIASSERERRAASGARGAIRRAVSRAVLGRQQDGRGSGHRQGRSLHAIGRGRHHLRPQSVAASVRRGPGLDAPRARRDGAVPRVRRSRSATGAGRAHRAARGVLVAGGTARRRVRRAAWCRSTPIGRVSMLRVRETRIERPRFPVIDIHTHLSWSGRRRDGSEDAEAVTYIGRRRVCCP